MTNNPYFNALIAMLYVAGVVTLMSLGSEIAPKEDNILMPVGMISLLTLSVAFMAYTFFYRPVLMLLDGKRKEAADLFLKTVALFAALTFCVLVASAFLFA